MNTTPYLYKSKIIGFCFLSAFLAYGFGRHYFESPDIQKKHLGALFIITNSTIVILIGVLLDKTLKKYNSNVGNIYLFTRIFEGLMLASVLINLVTNLNISIDLTYCIAMLVFGFGSTAMCFILYQHNIIPKWISIWGLIGYILFTIGFLLELFGRKWSMYFLGPGGLWEIVFGIWLITKKNELTP